MNTYFNTTGKLYANVTANRTFDPYLISLGAVVLLKYNKTAEVDKLLDSLMTYQAPDGSISLSSNWTQPLQTATNSGTRDRIIETTALACMAFSTNMAKTQVPLKNALNYLRSQIRGGSWGGSQATMWAFTVLTSLD